MIHLHIIHFIFIKIFVNSNIYGFQILWSEFSNIYRFCITPSHQMQEKVRLHATYKQFVKTRSISMVSKPLDLVQLNANEQKFVFNDNQRWTQVKIWTQVTSDTLNTSVLSQFCIFVLCASMLNLIVLVTFKWRSLSAGCSPLYFIIYSPKSKNFSIIFFILRVKNPSFCLQICSPKSAIIWCYYCFDPQIAIKVLSHPIQRFSHLIIRNSDRRI